MKHGAGGMSARSTRHRDSLAVGHHAVERAYSRTAARRWLRSRSSASLRRRAPNLTRRTPSAGGCPPESPPGAACPQCPRECQILLHRSEGSAVPTTDITQPPLDARARCGATCATARGLLRLSWRYLSRPRYLSRSWRDEDARVASDPTGPLDPRDADARRGRGARHENPDNLRTLAAQRGAGR